MTLKNFFLLLTSLKLKREKLIENRSIITCLLSLVYLISQACVYESFVSKSVEKWRVKPRPIKSWDFLSNISRAINCLYIIRVLKSRSCFLSVCATVDIFYIDRYLPLQNFYRRKRKVNLQIIDKRRIYYIISVCYDEVGTLLLIWKWVFSSCIASWLLKMFCDVMFCYVSVDSKFSKLFENFYTYDILFSTIVSPTVRFFQVDSMKANVSEVYIFFFKYGQRKL